MILIKRKKSTNYYDLFKATQKNSIPAREVVFDKYRKRVKE